MPTSLSSISIYKIDRFTVPSVALTAFHERLRRIQQVLDNQPGCRQNLVLTGADTGTGSRDFVTVVEWESEAAYVAARSAVQQRYAAEGFDPAAFMRQLGVIASMGVFRDLDPPA